MRTPTLNRRQFVVLGTATVAGIAAKLPAYATTQIPGSFVSIGYTSGRTRLRIGGRGSESPTSFVDATSLMSGDPAFFRAGARIRLHGFERSQVPVQPERLDVEVLFPLQGEEQPTPFYAFSSIHSPERVMAGNPVGFTVPSESTGTVEIAIQRQQIGGAGVIERVVVPFSVNDLGSNAYKLTEGVYAVALLRAGQAVPNWNAIRTDVAVTRHKKTAIRLVTDVWGDVVAVDFDYFLLSVAPADSPEAPAVRDPRTMTAIENEIG